MKSEIIGATLLVAMLSTSSIVHAAGESSFAIKMGNIDLDNTSNAITGGPFVFEESSSSVFSLEYEKQVRNNISWGVEVVSYSNAPVSGTLADADTVLVMGNARKYFDISERIKPFVGGGIGLTTINLDFVTVSGLSYQVMAGIKFPFKKISAILEYKLVSSEAEDSVGETIDTSGSGIFAGIAFNF